MWYVRDKGNAAIQADVQAILFSEYLEALVAGLSGIDCVLTGCTPTAQASPDMTVAIASGTVVSNGTKFTVSAGNATIGTADATNPRLDLVVVNSSGSIAVRAGTAAAAPAPPERTANDVILAVVYVPASDTTISSTQIVDLRAMREMFLGNPEADDGRALGTTSLRWSDLFLASGAVINFANGDATITHATGVITVAGAELVLAAGTTSLAPLKFTSGTNLTTPEAGAMEYDGKCFYSNPEASNRGVMLSEYFICLSSTNTLTSQTGQQPIFDSVGGGTLTLPTGLYFFESLLSVNTMSGTSGNMGFDLKGSGTATLGSILYHAVGIDGNTGTAATQTGSTSVASASPASIVTAGTGTVCNVSIRGTFRVTSAGTIIPGLSQVTAAAAVVAIGSYFRCRCVGSSSAQTCGQWS